MKLLILIASPIWLFEAAYLANCPPIELPQTTQATPQELQALWIAAGERELKVTPAWSFNFLEERPGARAAAWLAHHYASPRGQLRWQLQGAAAQVWLSRHADANALQRGLAEMTRIAERRRAREACTGRPASAAEIAWLIDRRRYLYISKQIPGADRSEEVVPCPPICDGVRLRE